MASPVRCLGPALPAVLAPTPTPKKDNNPATVERRQRAPIKVRVVTNPSTADPLTLSLSPVLVNA